VEEYTGTLTQKGQVTIPLPVRKRLGVKAHDQVRFRVTDEGVQLLPCEMTLEQAFGAVKPLRRRMRWKEVRRTAREEHLLRKYTSRNRPTSTRTQSKRKR
jgi:AbrB family looped-hinge helix DNA binding protein